MNNSLRGEIVDILQKVRAGLNVEINKDCAEGADEILTLIASKMPEKIDPQQFQSSLSGASIFPAKYTGFNEAIDKVKSILRGSD